MVQRKVQQATKTSTKLRLQRFYSLAFLLFSLPLFIACTLSHQWNAIHPSYQKAPNAKESIGLVGIQNAFILTRAKWFSNRLEIPMDSIHQYTEDLIQSTFVNEFKKHYPQTFIFSDSIQKNWSEESQKLDKVIFLKGRFPDQGVVIKKDNNEAPPYLFILHELMIGTDLDRNLYFDYTKGREEIEIKSTVKKITFIISYTLWDNLKQRPLVSSVIEIQDPFSKALTSSQLEQITQKAVHKIYDEITQGKH